MRQADFANRLRVVAVNMDWLAGMWCPQCFLGIDLGSSVWASQLVTCHPRQSQSTVLVICHPQHSQLSVLGTCHPQHLQSNVCPQGWHAARGV